MKPVKFLALALILVLAATAFAGCASRNRNDTTTPIPPITSSVPDVVSRIEEGADNAVSGIERGISEFEEDFGISTGENSYDEYRNENSAFESSRENSFYDESSYLEDSIAAMSTDFAEIGALDDKKDTGFPGGPVDSQNRPSGPLAYQQKYEKYGAYFIVPDSKKIYLTFDEGYENGYTSKLLDILKEKNVKAAFFITYPYAKSEPALVQRMVAEGHTLGNHSTKHRIFPELPLSEAANDLATLHDYVLANYGYKMTLFRPPEGAFSEQTLALAQKLGYTTFLWSFAYQDYDVQNQPLAIDAMDKIVSKAHPGEICLLHAVSRTNSEVLGDAIDTLRDKGFVFADYFYFQ